MRKRKLRRVAMARKVTHESIIASNPIRNRWSSSRGLSAIAELLVIKAWQNAGQQSFCKRPPNAAKSYSNSSSAVSDCCCCITILHETRGAWDFHVCSLHIHLSICLSFCVCFQCSHHWRTGGRGFLAGQFFDLSFRYTICCLSVRSLYLANGTVFRYYAAYRF